MVSGKRALRRRWFGFLVSIAAGALGVVLEVLSEPARSQTATDPKEAAAGYLPIGRWPAAPAMIPRAHSRTGGLPRSIFKAASVSGTRRPFQMPSSTPRNSGTGPQRDRCGLGPETASTRTAPPLTYFGKR